MTSVALSVVLQASILAAPGQPYEVAYQNSVTTGRPLVVLLGADWCPACVKMKKSVLPEVERSGALDGIEFTYVDVDRRPELSRALSRGSAIPQLIRFQRRGDQWESQLLTGAHSPNKVAQFIAGPEPKKERPGWAARLSALTEVITGKSGP